MWCTDQSFHILIRVPFILDGTSMRSFSPSSGKKELNNCHKKVKFCTTAPVGGGPGGGGVTEGGG